MAIIYCYINHETFDSIHILGSTKTVGDVRSLLIEKATEYVKQYSGECGLENYRANEGKSVECVRLDKNFKDGGLHIIIMEHGIELYKKKVTVGFFTTSYEMIKIRTYKSAESPTEIITRVPTNRIVVDHIISSESFSVNNIKSQQNSYITELQQIFRDGKSILKSYKKEKQE